MTPLRRALLPSVTLVAAMATASPAGAQVAVTPFVGASFAGETGFVDLEGTAGDVKPLYGVSVGWRVTRRLLVAFEGSWMPHFLRDTGELVERGRLTSWIGQADCVIWPRPSASRPQLFVTGGIGVVRVDLDDVLDAFAERSIVPAATVGGGVLLPLRDRVRLRSDVRYVRSTFAEGGRSGFDTRHVSFWRVTSGVMVGF